MLKIEEIARRVLVSFTLILAGCPYTVTGHLWSVKAHISPRPVDLIRANVLALGGFEGPRDIIAGSLCLDGKHYEKRLTQSGVRVRVYDCYGKSNVSDTGWAYSVTVAADAIGLEKTDARKEINTLVEEIRKVVQGVVGDAKVTTTDMETGFGFSLLPY